MEFENDDHEEELEEEDDEEEQQINIPPQPTTTTATTHENHFSALPTTQTGGRKGAAAAATTIRYRECQKNHAVSTGGHAVDGCGEFMPTGEEGTLDSLKCAACNCHRNFHRKETDTAPYAAVTPNFPRAVPPPMYPQFPPPFYRTPPPPPPPGFFHHHHTQQLHHLPLALPPSSEMDELSNPSSSGGGSGKKRFRTKFTAEQKERMLEFAEKVGWRIQKHDEAAVQQFCEELQVNRQVLKVWMHNNKNTLGGKP